MRLLKKSVDSTVRSVWRLQFVVPLSLFTSFISLKIGYITLNNAIQFNSTKNCILHNDHKVSATVKKCFKKKIMTLINEDVLQDCCVKTALGFLRL